MKHYLHKFADQAAYNTAKAGSSFYKPAVSLIEGDMSLRYDPLPPAPTIEMVDLGLTSETLWAKTNIGAQTETDYGQYFAWGELAQYAGWPSDKSTHPYDWNEYIYAESKYNELTKYCNNSKYGYNGYTDELTELVAADDIVAVTYGGSYRMPTQDDFQELIDETDNEWVEDFNGSGVSGYKFTSKSDSSKYIFLPAAGYCYDSNLFNVGGEGGYWSSSLDADDPYRAGYLFFTDGEVFMHYNNRCYGFSVRPVQHIS